MKISQILFLLSSMSIMSPALADDEGGDYESAPVMKVVQTQETELDSRDDYDNGDYEAAPVAQYSNKASKKTAKAATPVKRSPKKNTVTVAKQTRPVNQQHMARYLSFEDPFE